MSSEIFTVTRDEFLERVYEDTDRFMASIAENDVYVVKSFYPREQVLGFREMLAELRAESEPSWHPCLDGVPDYHRINDEYPESWVKAKMHSYYFHRFNERGDLFEPYRDIFELKNFLAGEERDAHLDAIPSDEIISRVVSHQYPRGGGYLAEHSDPKSKFATLQTIIQASEVGEDFTERRPLHAARAERRVRSTSIRYSDAGRPDGALAGRVARRRRRSIPTPSSTGRATTDAG